MSIISENNICIIVFIVLLYLSREATSLIRPAILFPRVALFVRSSHQLPPRHDLNFENQTLFYFIQFVFLSIFACVKVTVPLFVFLFVCDIFQMEQSYDLSITCHDVLSRAKELDLCTRFKIESLQKRRDTQLACIMYRLRVKMKSLLIIVREEKIFEVKISFKKFNCPFTKNVKVRKSPLYRGIDLWNSSKVEHHRAENKKKFKNLLKNTL